MAPALGHTIDGAWWPRTGRIAGELPELVEVLSNRLGEIIDIKVNWSSSAEPPRLDSYGSEVARKPVMTIGGRNARANLLLVPHLTGTALALMVLRRAAELAINPAHRGTRAFQTADFIVRDARSQTAAVERHRPQARHPVSRS